MMKHYDVDNALRDLQQQGIGLAVSTEMLDALYRPRGTIPKAVANNNSSGVTSQLLMAPQMVLQYDHDAHLVHRYLLFPDSWCL